MRDFVVRWIAAIIDITDRRAQEQLLQQQNEALKENVRLREEVERIGRHDIKTPLNSIVAVPRPACARSGAAIVSSGRQSKGNTISQPRRNNKAAIGNSSNSNHYNNSSSNYNNHNLKLKRKISV